MDNGYDDGIITRELGGWVRFIRLDFLLPRIAVFTS
jgi:hypothetical protein